MENRLRLRVSSFVITLLFMFFIGAAITAGVMYILLGGTQVVEEAQAPEGELDFSLLEEIYEKYQEHYIYDIDPELVIDNAAKGMVYGMEDAYGTYFNPEEYAEFQSEDKGEYVGIGILINIGENNKISVAQVYKGSPAEKAGIIPGDLLVGVNGMNTVGTDYEKVVDMVRGEEGTEVTVTFERKGETYDAVMIRAKIIADQTEWWMVDDEIGYIKIHQFSGNASTLFHKALDELEAAGAEGYILDLRNNPGGSKFLAVQIGDTLFPKGDIITLIDSKGNEEVDTSDARYLNKPLVVLINGGSASASELLSGGIQDYGIGELVGEVTFGKGVAQGFYFLDNGGVLRITSSYYETAGGTSPQDVGIIPDYEVILDEEVQLDPSLLTTEKDNQMQKGLEVLRELMEQVN